MKCLSNVLYQLNFCKVSRYLVALPAARPMKAVTSNAKAAIRLGRVNEPEYCAMKPATNGPAIWPILKQTVMRPSARFGEWGARTRAA